MNVYLEVSVSAGPTSPLQVLCNQETTALFQPGTICPQWYPTQGLGETSLNPLKRWGVCLWCALCSANATEPGSFFGALPDCRRLSQVVPPTAVCFVLNQSLLENMGNVLPLPEPTPDPASSIWDRNLYIFVCVIFYFGIWNVLAVRGGGQSQSKYRELHCQGAHLEIWVKKETPKSKTSMWKSTQSCFQKCLQVNIRHSPTKQGRGPKLHAVAWDGFACQTPWKFLDVDNLWDISWISVE